MNHSRTKVLAAFKSLHRARKDTFKGDEIALAAARLRINEEFQLQKNLTDQNKIDEGVKTAREVEEILRKAVIQATRTEEGNYRLKFGKETEFLDTGNPYTEMPQEMIGPFKGKRPPCAQEK